MLFSFSIHITDKTKDSIKSIMKDDQTDPGTQNFKIQRKTKELDLHFLQRYTLRGDLIDILTWVKGLNRGGLDKVLVVETDLKTDNMGTSWTSSGSGNRWA